MSTSPKARMSQPMPPMYPGGMRIGNEEEQAVLDVLRAKRLFRYYGPNPGPSQVEQLELSFAKFMGAEYSLAVTSCTAALICGLVGLGIGPGDEVIIPAYTWIATASAVLAAGAIPILAEVDDSLTLDPQDVAAKISPYTRAIIPVHMRGAPCNMDALLALAKKHNLQVLEDVAQAAGGSYGGRRLGSLGDAGAFSLQYNKIMTSGEGGMLITPHQSAYHRAVMYHDVVGGQRNNIPAENILPGINFRMPELLGAVARVQLLRLEGLLADMRARKEVLKSALESNFKDKGVAFRRLNDPAGDAAIALVMFMPSADCAQETNRMLVEAGVDSGVLYYPDVVDYHIYSHWAPIMGQRTWTSNGGPWKDARRRIEYDAGMCPRTLDLLGRALHLNISPDLPNAQIEELIDVVSQVVEESLP